jgi:hypothetical protein
MTTGTVTLNQQEYPVSEVELHLPLDAGVRMMYLGVVTDSEAGGFGLWDVELAMLEDIDGLDGGRIHVKPDGECYDDDTLGTDMVGAYETSDLNYWGAKGKSYCYGEILVDFKRIEGRKYTVHFECTLTDSENDSDDLLPEDYQYKGSADFTVEVDEKDPYDD